MNFDFLGNDIVQALNKIDTERLYEIRLRENYTVKVKLGNGNHFLSDNGIKAGAPILCSKYTIENIINNITQNSVYAFNEKIKRGYLTVNGVRVGLAGECVSDNGRVITLKNVTSLNVRIPHEILGCSNKVMKFVFNKNKLQNTLIVSPPFCGKTTILKDLATKLNGIGKFNLLIIDERGEFEKICGENIDKILYSDKLYAFEYGIRSLSPSVVMTDELSGKNDWECVKSASDSGVKIIASCHAGSLDGVRNKPYFIKGVFDRYVILKNNGRPGIIENVYDKDFKVL